MSSGEPFVVEVDRSGLIESIHLVDVAVAGSNGKLVAWAGEPDTVAYLRSSAKPIQTLACLESGWRAPGTEQVAVACASHNGEPRHVEAIRVTLSAAGFSEDALRCPAAWPFRPEDAAAVNGSAPILHNCSGKHAAMLATAKENGWTLEDYRAAEHPMQRAVATQVERLAGASVRHTGVDGCGVPTFALSLTESARLFARLAEDGRDVLDAMADHPFLVAGTGRLCTAVMSARPGVVIKIGAEGLSCGVLRDQGLAFALKARDGTQRARDIATVATLKVLGSIDDDVPEMLAPHAAPAVLGGGEPAGSIRCTGVLERA
ncbi:MAG: asparaginase [Actinomycetota bacterium]